MPDVDRRAQSDRRRFPRGGRRPYDKPGRYPLVLVADGFDVVRRSCAQYLDQLNFDVVQASTHEDMTVLLSMSTPQLIVAALTLRGAAAKADWISAVHAGAIPMIAIANVDAATASIPTTEGVLRRPFTRTDMIAEVRRVLRAAEQASSTPIDLQPTPQSDMWASSLPEGDGANPPTSPNNP